MKTILRKEIQTILKEKGTFIWLIAMPIVFIVLFASILGSASNSTLTIHYLDQDNTASSRAFIQNIDGIKGFAAKTDTETSVEDQIQKVKDGKLSCLIVIPKGFEDAVHAGTQQTNLEFYRTSVTDQVVESSKAILQNIANQYRENKLKIALTELTNSGSKVEQLMAAPVNLKEVSEDAANYNMITQVVPGYTVMFVFFIMITMTRNFIKEKESGMLSRLRSTPMKPMDYLAGMWASNVIIVLVQCTILLGFGHMVYNLNLGDMSAVIALVISLAICVTGIGLALSFLVSSENQGVAYTQIITMGGAILGGLWFPFELLPSFAQTVGHCIPQYWAQHGLLDIMLRNAHIGDLWQNIAVLLAFGAVGLTVALLRFKRFILSATN